MHVVHYAKVRHCQRSNHSSNSAAEPKKSVVTSLPRKRNVYPVSLIMIQTKNKRLCTQNNYFLKMCTIELKDKFYERRSLVYIFRFWKVKLFL